MKKTFKIVTYFILVVIAFILVLLITAKLAENKISDMALKKVSESIEAPVSIAHVSFNLLRKFPLASIELKQVLLGEQQALNHSDSSVTNSDTIASINTIYVSVKSIPLFKGIVEIIKVDVEGAIINYQVDTSGASNIDFLLQSDETSSQDTTPSEPLNLSLTDLSLKNIHCNYTDKKIKAAAKLNISSAHLKAKLEGEDVFASIRGAIDLSDCNFEETNLYLMNKTDINVELDYENDLVKIKELGISTDGASLHVKGSVVLNDDITTDLTFKGSDILLGELIKYVPDEMLKEYGLQKISGRMMLDAYVKGIYSESEMPRLDLSLDFQDGEIVSKNYPAIKKISFQGQLSNGLLRNNQSMQAEFSSFHCETKQSKFDLAFSVLDLDHPKYDVNANMDINVSDFNDLIPDSLIQSINGNIKANISTKGELPDSIGDDFVDYVMANSRANIQLSNFNMGIDSSLSIKNFSSSISYKPNNIKINALNISIPEYKVNVKNTSLDANFSGSLSNTTGMCLDLKSYHIETDKSEISGSAQVQNFDHPTYSFTGDIKLNLDEVKTMLPDSLVNNLEGNVKANIKSSGTLNLDSIADQAMDLVFNNSEFNFNFDDISVEMPDDPLYKIENFSGLVNMNSKAISMNKMKGIAAGIEFEIDSTRIENVYKSVIKNQAEQLIVNTSLSLGDIDYSMFAAFMETDSSALDSIQNEPKLTTNENLQEAKPTNFTMLIKGVAKVKSLTYGKVFVEDISTLFNVQDSVYTIDQFKIKAFDGNMNTSVKYTVKPDNKSIIEMHNIVEGMDVKKLLLDFDDFKDYYEPSISHENLSGLFSTDMFSRIVMIGDSLVQKDMRVLGDFTIENGGVYNYEPATNMSKFTGIKELDNIKFKTFTSNLFIFKGAIYVPETFISSTALDIEAYGMQSFGEDYEFHLQIQLAEILFGKSKKELKKQAKSDEEVTNIEGGTREIVSYSLDGKNKNGFDNKSLQKKMKNKIMMQEKILSARFNPRLVNFDTKVYPKVK